MLKTDMTSELWGQPRDSYRKPGVAGVLIVIYSVGMFEQVTEGFRLYLECRNERPHLEREDYRVSTVRFGADRHAEVTDAL
jgi:hypothetical protein